MKCRVPCQIFINPNEFDKTVIKELTKIYDNILANEDERKYFILGDVINKLSCAQIVVYNRNR